MKLLIADDSIHIRQLLKEALRDGNGIETIDESQDVPGTIESIKKNRPDVVILDLQMPGGNGLDVLKSLKAAPRKPIVIVYTNFPYQEYELASLKAGAEYFFDKSLEQGEMLALVSDLSSRQEDIAPD